MLLFLLLALLALPRAAGAFSEAVGAIKVLGVLNGVLERTRGLVSGVTCGAGMPYKLSEIAAWHKVSYLPIISSARVFDVLAIAYVVLVIGVLFRRI